MRSVPRTLPDRYYEDEKFRRYYDFQLLTDPERTVKHLRMLKAAPYYMSNARIAELSGVCQSNICQMLRGRRGEARGYEAVKGVHLDTEAAILAVRPENNPPARGGGHVDPVGTRRRLQALAAAGFPLKYLSEQMGWGTDPQPVHRVITGKAAKKYVFHSTYRKACELYDKLSCADPYDMGFESYAIKRAQGASRRNGYALPSCWDADTIDDPGSIAEWTGACGTPYGYEIHCREDIPVCPPCQTAVDKINGRDRVFDPRKFKALRKKAGYSVVDFADAVDVRADTVYQWQRNNPWSPQPEHLARIYEVLGCSEADLFEERMKVPGASQTYAQRRMERHMFSAVKFREIKEKRGMSRRKLAEATGLSTDAIDSWSRGRTKPVYENLLKLAEALNTDPEEFMREDM